MAMYVLYVSNARNSWCSLQRMYVQSSVEISKKCRQAYSRRLTIAVKSYYTPSWQVIYPRIALRPFSATQLYMDSATERSW